MEKFNSTTREVNPFEDPEVAEQWIKSVEGEKGLIRDREIYPLLNSWAREIEAGVIVEIGSGQGVCSQHLGDFSGNYIGVEPSEILTSRAQALYNENKRMSFIMGNAYELPLSDTSADGIFSVNVWFHLADLTRASAELARILKPKGQFNIITANPDSYEAWKGFYEDSTIQGKLLSGKVNVPVSPMSRNDFYMHTMEEIIQGLNTSGLNVTSVEPLGTMSKSPETPIFVSIQGSKM